MKELTMTYASQVSMVLGELVDGRCVSITGLSNSGKSILMRALASAESAEAYTGSRGRGGVLLYVDCNQAVDLSGQAFNEVVIRTALERLSGSVSTELDASLKDYHEAITQAGSAFAASLSFNLALTEICEGLESDLILLLDEFDEVYASLEERALLNLRALRDRFSDRLAYVTATVRALPALRGRDVEGEFAELFTRSTHAMALMEAGEADLFVQETLVPDLTEPERKVCLEMAGGHPGLLAAVAQVIAAAPDGIGEDPIQSIGREPQPRAECLKIWNQLTEIERKNLISLAVEPEEGLPARQVHHLEGLALVKNGALFSPIFQSFVARKGRPSAVKVEGVHLDVDSGDVWVEGVRIPVLTDLEFRLLELLHERRDKLTDKYRIVTAVWGEEYLPEVDDARVEKLVSRLRSKIEPDPGNPKHLVTQRGRGYKLLSRPRAV